MKIGMRVINLIVYTIGMLVALYIGMACFFNGRGVLSVVSLGVMGICIYCFYVEIIELISKKGDVNGKKDK